jgi:outer membrane protein TolC
MDTADKGISQGSLALRHRNVENFARPVSSELMRFVVATFLLLLVFPSISVAEVLTLDEARTRASEAAIAVLTDQMERDFAKLAARSARQPFVPRFGADVGWRDSVSLFQEGVRDRTIDYGASFDWTLPIGTRLRAAAGSTEFLSGTSFVPLPTTSVEFGVAQPLLRGGWNSSNLLEQRDLEVELQKALFVDNLNAFLVDVDRAYWDLALAEADIKIKLRSRDRARKQYNDTKANIDRGLLAPGEIFVVEENLVIFEQQLLRSQENLVLARLQLARLLRVPPDSELSTGDELTRAPLESPKFEASLAAAMGNNPALVVQQIASKQAEVVVDFRENQWLPSLDVSAAVVSVGTDEDRATAWQQALTAENLDYRAGIEFSVPLDFGPNDATVESAELQHTRVQLQIDDVHDTINYGLRGLFAQLVRRRQILEKAQKLVELARNKLETEREKYKSGLATLIDVVRFQRDLDGALITEQRARVDVLMLQSRIAQLEGNLYRRAGLSLDGPSDRAVESRSSDG